MSETAIEVPQEQPQAQTLSGLDRLSMDPAFIFGDHKPTPIDKGAEAPAVETVAAEVAALEAPEIPEAKPAETPAVAAEIAPEAPPEIVGFEESTPESQEDGSWKTLIESFGYQLPEDYTEEKGQEIFVQLKEQEIATKLQEVQNFKELELFSTLPEKNQGEARLIYELMKTGQSLEEINAPFEQIKAWRAMPKEELIRKNLEGVPGTTPEQVDHMMEKIVSNNHVDVEYNILINDINNLEGSLKLKRKEQIEINNAQQEQIREQKRQQEFNSFKAALDKVPEFMDRKLSDDNKASVIKDYNNGFVQQLLRNPEKIAKFMLFDKYGEQGLKYIQSRAIEKATLEKAKAQLNIPPVLEGTANRTSTATQNKNGLDRLANDPRFA